MSKISSLVRDTTGLRAVLLTGALLSVSACGSARTIGSPFDGTAGRGASGVEEPIRVEVQNLNFNDVTIYAMRQSQRMRIGRVTGKTDQTFDIDWNLALPISFVIDVTGGRSCRTGSVGVERNGRVWISVPSNVGTQPCRVGRR